MVAVMGRGGDHECLYAAPGVGALVPYPVLDEVARRDVVAGEDHGGVGLAEFPNEDSSKMLARHRERRQNKGELIEGPVERGCWCACGFVIYFRWVCAFALLALFVDGLNRISKSYFYGLQCSNMCCASAQKLVAAVCECMCID